MALRWMTLAVLAGLSGGCATLLGDDFSFDEGEGPSSPAVVAQGGAAGSAVGMETAGGSAGAGSGAGAGGASGGAGATAGAAGAGGEEPGLLRVVNLIADKRDISVCIRPHGSGEVFLDATLAFYGLDGGVLPPGKMTAYQRFNATHLDIGLSASQNCAAPTVELDVELPSHPHLTLVLSGSIDGQASATPASEGWFVLRDRATAPAAGEFLGRGVHAIAGGPDLELVSWLEGPLDSKVFRGLSFKKQPVGIARKDPFYTVDELGYANVSVAIDSMAYYEVLAPAHGRRLGLVAPDADARARLKDPGNGAAPPALSLFVWGALTQAGSGAQATLEGAEVLACFEDYQVRKGLTDCVDVGRSDAVSLAPVRLGNMTPQRVRACLKPKSFGSWRLSPPSGVLLEPFSLLREVPTPPDIYEAAFVAEGDECTAVEAGAYAPLPMNVEWVALPKTKTERTIISSYGYGGGSSSRLVFDVLPPDADYAMAKAVSMIGGAKAISVGIEGKPSLVVEVNAGTSRWNKGDDAAKLDGLSGYASFAEDAAAQVVVTEIASGVRLRASGAVAMSKAGVYSIWLSGDWAKREDPASDQRPRAVVCDDLSQGGDTMSCQGPFDLQVVP